MRNIGPNKYCALPDNHSFVARTQGVIIGTHDLVNGCPTSPEIN